MSNTFSVHRLDEAYVIYHLGSIRKQLGHMLATLTILLEAPQRFHQLPFALLPKCTKAYTCEIVILIMTLNQFRLEVIRIDMTGTASHEKENHPLCTSRKHRATLKQCRRTQCRMLPLALLMAADRFAPPVRTLTYEIHFACMYAPGLLSGPAQKP